MLLPNIAYFLCLSSLVTSQTLKPYPTPMPNLLQYLVNSNTTTLPPPIVPIVVSRNSDKEPNLLEEFGVQVVQQGEGLIQDILNTVQLTIRNIIDQFVPNLKLQPPPSQDFVDFNVDEFTLPPPFHRVLQTCPPCLQLDSSLFAEKIWDIIYANDNFIKSQLDEIVRASEGEQTGNTLQDLFRPVRHPVCAKLRVGRENSFGILTDYPSVLSFSESHGTGKARIANANLRYAGDGKYLMAFPGTNVNIKLCAVFSNILDPTVHLEVKETTPGMLVFADMDGVPQCINFLVLSTDRQTYFQKFDTQVMNFIDSYKADTNANPIQYIGCPPNA